MDQTNTSIAALCGFKVSAVSGATISDRPIRYDFASKLISVKDAIMAIEGVTPTAARSKLDRLKADKIIAVSEGPNAEYTFFRDETNRK